MKDAPQVGLSAPTCAPPCDLPLSSPASSYSCSLLSRSGRCISAMATSGTSSIPTPEAPPCLGYVDHAPIVAPQARLGEWLFGDSVFAIRVLSAIAGAGTVILTCILAWAMGGRLPAQALAMFRVLVCSPFIGVDGFLSMELL